jgi:hypothetical protein
MRATVILSAVVLAAAGCSGGSAPRSPLGRGESLQSISIYQGVDATHPAKHVRLISMGLLNPDGSIRREKVDRQPLLVLHPTAAQVQSGYLELYAPEATNLIDYQQASSGVRLITILRGRGYQVGTIGGDPDGLDIAIQLHDEALAESIAHQLTSRVRVLPTPSRE